MFRLFALTAALSLLSTTALAEVDSDNYRIPSDVQPAGGGEKALSDNYVLSDTIGEANVGPSGTPNYRLDAGYRQIITSTISLTCSGDVDLGTITGFGRQTGSGSCVVITDADAGYSLAWQVTTGSGGTFTGYLINPLEETIAPFTPAVAGTPETWTIASTASEWGGRLSSASTDTDAKWGTNGVSDKWLNVGTGSYTIVERESRTDIDGSTEILEFRVEVGSDKIQPDGTYATTVTLIAASL